MDQYSFVMGKKFPKVGTKNFLSLIKDIYKNSTDSSTLTNEKINAFPLD